MPRHPASASVAMLRCMMAHARSYTPTPHVHVGATFKELVNAAYLDRTDLSAHGFYATPGITGFGGNRPFNYFVFGAAVAEVELDCLTGEGVVTVRVLLHKVLRPYRTATSWTLLRF